jgi:hypothetical protein
MTKLGGFIELGAGAALGLLVGLIAGLSISPVTSTVLGALSAGLLILLGFKESKDGVHSGNHGLRVLGFGVFCSISLVAGISLRTHQTLSPSLEKQRQSLSAAQVFTPGEIEQILLSTNFGIQPSPKTLTGGNGTQTGTNRPAESDQPGLKGQPGDLAIAGYLRAGSADFCQLARREKFRDVHGYVAELNNIDPRLAHVIESAPESDRDRLSKSLSEYLCP